MTADIRISIHAPRVGRDNGATEVHLGRRGFQSTRPVWGATRSNREMDAFVTISIHAPRVGRDALT